MVLYEIGMFLYLVESFSTSFKTFKLSALAFNCTLRSVSEFEITLPTLSSSYSTAKTSGGLLYIDYIGEHDVGENDTGHSLASEW